MYIEIRMIVYWRNCKLAGRINLHAKKLKKYFYFGCHYSKVSKNKEVKK